ncbi:MAG TPA: LysM peptidoglycan-binding domain-containing protein, partial [Chloroflexia bacterium]
MDIKTLAATIQGNFVTGTTLTVPAAGAQSQLQSPDIANLITNYVAGTLTITGISPNPPVPVAGTVAYTGQMSFLGQTFTATATFYLVNTPTDGTPELTLALPLPANWTFSKTYPPLKDQLIDQLTYTQPNFVLESFKNDGTNTFEGLAQGLNFTGGLQSSSSPLLSPINWLLAANLQLSGTLTNWNDPKNTAPTMTLETPPGTTSLTLGTVVLSTYIEATSGYTASSGAGREETEGDSSTLATSVDLVGTVATGSGTLLTLTMALQTEPDLLVFSLNANQALNSLADLAGFSNGSSLSNMIPSQYPLSQLLTLDDFTITVAPALQQIVNLSFGIKLLQPASTLALAEAGVLEIVPARLGSFSPILGQPKKVYAAEIDPETGHVVLSEDRALATDPTSPTWVIIPGVISINDIFLNFLIIDPLHISSNNIFAKIGATFWIGETYPITISISLPDITVNGYLPPGNTIPLAEVMANFGLTPPEGFELDVTELNMTANPSYKTYDLSTTLEGNVTLISLNDGKFNLTLTQITVEISVDDTGFSGQIMAYSNFAQVVDFYILAQKGAGAGAGWLFKAAITHPFSVGQLIENVTGWQPPSFVYDMSITVFSLSYDTGQKAMTFDVGFGWTFPDLQPYVDGINLLFHLQSSVDKATQATLYSGSIQGDFLFLGLKLTFIYAFDQVNKTNTYTLKFGKATATFADPDKSGDKVLQVNFGNTTFGDILVFLIKLADPGASSKLSAPWDALNSISLANLSLTINFTKNFIEIDYKGTFDLTFIKITNVSIRYTRNYGNGQVQVSLQGNFLGQDFGKDNPVTWDAMNGQPPAVPGAGTKLLDLQFVGVGQHVTMDVTDITTMTQAITAMEKTVVPLTNTSKNPLEQVGGLHFDSTSNWLLGADFTVLSTFSINIVFIDPVLYGLLIKVSGPEAAIFEGLSFEILYRKITDDIGVYHIELKLPDAMRHLEFGEVSVTLPIIILDIYTNGNFRIDFGFPISLQDFSNSFSIQVFPFVGYGGFYFALLNGATSSRVPQITNGTFNPVIEFGFALSVGVGKTLTIGPLSAGVSVTVIGMLQGAFAWFNPTDASTPKSLYYWLQGTIAVVGQVYGTVDFVVVKATVSLTVYASITLTIESYKPIIIYMKAGVEVKVSIKIIFITIHFSFSATITLTFTIGSPSTPPWTLAQPAPNPLQMRNQRSLHSPAPYLAARGMPHHFLGLRFNRPQRLALGARPVAASNDPPLTLMLTPLISQALPTDFLGGQSGAPVVTCNLLLLVENAVPPAAQNAAQASVPVAGAAQVPFNILLGKLLTWAIQWIGKDTGDSVTAAELESIHEQLDQPDAIAQLFSYTNLKSFFTAFNVVFEIDLRPTTQPANGDLSASFFPMFPELALNVQGKQTSFWNTNPVDSDYVTQLSAYFEQLMVQYENNVEQDPQQTGQNLRQAKTLAVDDASPTSMAGYLFSAYFALLAKAVIQNAQDFLTTYSYTVTNSSTTSLQDIAYSFPAAEAEYVVRRGDTYASIAAQFAVPSEMLLSANVALTAGAAVGADAAPAPGTRITVPVPVTPDSIVTANQSTPGLLTNGGAPFTLQLADLVYQVKAGQSFKDVAAALSFTGIAPVDPAMIVTANADQESLLLVGSSFALPTLSYTGKTGDTVANVATYFGVPASDVTQQTGTLNFTITGAKHTVSSGFVIAYALKAGDTLASITEYFFAPTSDELAIYEQMLQSWNMLVDFSTAAPGTPIQIPYAESLTHLARYYFPNTPAAGQLAALMPSVVAQPVLAPLATLAVPTLNYPPQAADTLSGVAQKLNLTLAELTKKIATQDGIFPNNTVLTIPNVPSIQVADLVSGLASSPLSNNAAVTTSRFLLQGLRLPYPNMTDKTYPLYSLTGQQFPGPTAQTALSLQILETVPWVTFANDATTLPITFDTQEQTFITAFGATTLDPQICWLGRLPLYKYQPLHYTVQNALHWQAAALPAGACFAENGQIVSEPTIWSLPATLLGQTAQATGRYLLYDMAVSTYIDATSGLQTKPVQCYSWATTVNLTLRQVPAASGDSASMPNTYLLVGADDVGKQALFDVMNYLNAPSQTDTAQLYILYPPDPSGSNPKGVASDQLDTANTFLLKTNLSTETHSGAMLFSATPEALAANTGETYGATIDQANEFITLLWEGSVVKSGGYYLRYTNSGKGALPGYLFTGGTEATITLLVLLASQTKSSAGGLLPFNNVVVIGDNLDASQSNVFAEPVTYAVQYGDTLQKVVTNLPQYGLDVPSVALASQTIQGLLKPGTSMQINATTPYTIQYGDTLASIAAAHAPATVTSIANASAGLAILTPGALVQLAGMQTYVVQPNDTLSKAVSAIAAPGLDVPTFALDNQFNLQLLKAGQTLNLTSTTTYKIQPGDTLASIALANPPTTVQGIAVASKDLAILNTGVIAFYGSQQMEMQASVPPGNVGFQMWRNYVDSDPNQQQLNQLFNLLGFSIAGNAYFKTSNEGLPAGPQREPGVTDTDDDDGIFYYKQVIAAFKSATAAYILGPVSPALPDPTDSPYAGIYGDPVANNYSAVQIDLAFHDLAGNLTNNKFAGKLPNCNNPLALNPIPVGYTDDLIGLAQWPSVSAAFDFPTAKPQMQIGMTFSTAQYLPGSGQSYAGSHQSALTHFENYKA